MSAIEKILDRLLVADCHPKSCVKTMVLRTWLKWVKAVKSGGIRLVSLTVAVDSQKWPIFKFLNAP